MDGSIGPVTGTVAIAGVVAGAICLAVLHRMPTGLSPWHNAVSQYGITRFRIGYRMQTLSYAIAGAALAVGIDRAVGGPGAALTVVLCALFAASRAAISWFPMDEPGTARTATGRRHGLLAIVAFLSIALAAEHLPQVLHRDDIHPDVATASDALALLMLATIVAMVLTGRRGWFGLVERLFYAEITIWIFVVAQMLLH